MLVLVKKDWGIQDILRSYEDPGRKKGKVAGSHMDELVASEQAVILCDLCVHKFNAQSARYRKPARFFTVRAKCDDCRVFGFGTLFVSEKTQFG